MDLRALFSLLTRISELFARSVVIGLLPLLLVALAKAEQPKPPVADGKPLLVAAEGKSQPEQKADGKLSVLFAFSSAGDPCSYEFAARLVHDGVEVNSRRESLAARSLTWDEVKPYNVLAVSGIGFANADGTLSGKDKQNLEIINRFLEAGGGIFFIPCWGQMDSQIPPQAAFLKPLGATPHFDEMVFDHEPMIRATAWKMDFSYTSEVAPSPLTTNVKGLWIPVASRMGAGDHLVPFAVDGAWKTVITTAPTTYSLTVPLTVFTPSKEITKGRFTERVPLVASREVGKGRLVVCAINPAWLWGNYASSTLEGVTLERGLRDKPSDGYLLVLNSLRWLAEPSSVGSVLGGARTEPSQLVNPLVTRFKPPYSWATENTAPFAHIDKTWPGVVGARSGLSGGKGTTEEWVAEAKKSGLKYLVFLEEFSQLTEPKFAQLKAECAKLTDAEFAAIPGIRINDEAGNHYFYASPTLLYPPKKILSDDGKMIVAYDPGINSKDPRADKGQINSSALLYAYQLCGFKLLAGAYLYRGGTSPVANWFGLCDAMGVITSQGGKVVEDATQEYLQNLGAGQSLLPIAIDLIEDPARLAQTSWRTVLRMASGDRLVAGKLDGVNPVVSYFSQWNFYPDNPNRIFVTDGPQIDYWSSLGPRDYEGTERGDFVWESLRWRVGGKVHSEAGLKEVAVYDGAKLFRRFLPGGAKEFAFEMDLTHDRQHNLAMIVTDKAGHRAIGHELWDRNHRLQEFNCADRNNQLSYGYSTRTEDQTKIMLGGNQPLSTPNKRVIDSSISPSGTFKNDPSLGAPAFDGAAGGEPEVSAPVIFRIKGGTEIVAPRVGDSRRLLHSGDVNIGEGVCSYRFADNVGTYNVWHSLWKPELSKDIVVTRRNHFFQIDPDSPLAVFYWRVRIDLKCDQPNADTIKVGLIQNREANLWAVRGSDGTVLSGNNEETLRSLRLNEVLPFSIGAYAAALDSPLGGAAVFPLSDGLDVSWSTPQTKQIEFQLAGASVPRKQGEIREVELLLLGIPRSTKYTRQFGGRTTQVVERFRRDFGLGESGPSYKVAIASGKIISQRYFLKVDGTDGQAFSGVINGSLISSLPIVVSGLNNAWSAFLYDRALKAARPIGMLENQAWATVPIHGRADLFVGHPVTCDRSEIVLQLTQTKADGWHLEAHNPTDVPVATQLRGNPQFDPLKCKTLPDGSVTIPAGASVGFDL